MPTTNTPFDDFRFLLENLPQPDRARGARVRASLDPASANGPAGDLAAWLAEWGSGQSPASRPALAIFAGAHGVAGALAGHEPGWTERMVARCTSGEAEVARLCAAGGYGLKVFDLALEMPTADIRFAAAMDERTCAATMAFGMEAIIGGPDLVCISDIGSGNRVAAAAMLHALDRHDGGHSRDNGPDRIDPDARVEQLAAEALAHHAGHLADPFEIMRRLGGREIAAATGAILAARMERIPVLLDGYATTAAAAVLDAINPAALEHCRLACVAGQAGHAAVARYLKLTPLLGGAYGSGAVGGALALGLAKAASALVADGK